MFPQWGVRLPAVRGLPQALQAAQAPCTAQWQKKVPIKVNSQVDTVWSLSQLS